MTLLKQIIKWSNLKPPDKETLKQILDKAINYNDLDYFELLKLKEKGYMDNEPLLKKKLKNLKKFYYYRREKTRPRKAGTDLQLNHLFHWVDRINTWFVKILYLIIILEGITFLCFYSALKYHINSLQNENDSLNTLISEQYIASGVTFNDSKDSLGEYSLPDQKNKNIVKKDVNGFGSLLGKTVNILILLEI